FYAVVNNAYESQFKQIVDDKKNTQTDIAPPISAVHLLSPLDIPPGENTEDKKEYFNSNVEKRAWIGRYKHLILYNTTRLSATTR
ncbi:MAG TPA: hypothetical protein VI423_09010, partial [Paenisporosarcina sp.]|nr:hypothetical protein [Paenisporosarcina sp.]